MSAWLQEAEFWVVVAFIIFVIMMIKPVTGVMMGALDQRIAKIREEVEEAQRLREEAQAALASYQRRQREAMQEAEEIVVHAREEAERTRTAAAAALKQAMKRRERQAVDKIAQAEAAAIQEIRELAVDLAIAATARLLAEKLGDQAGGRMVDDAIKDLPDKLH